MVNLEKGPSSLHIGLNGSSDALLDQRHCQSKGNEPAPCACTSDINLQPLPHEISVWNRMAVQPVAFLVSFSARYT